ncbi:MAG: glycosyltransferase [Acidobacteriota bacterium]
MFLVDVLRPATIVELGTFSGVSYCAFCQAVAQLGLDCRCCAVDSWKGDEQSGFFGPEILNDLRQHHDPLYGGFSKLVQSTFDQALSHFADATIDLLHIDGYHTYDSVKHDFDGWLRKMSNRGVILFHDTNERHDDFGVWKLWDQLKLRYPHFEFTHGHGLGVLAVGDSYPKKLSELFEAGPDERALVRELFHRLGERLSIQLNGDHALKTLSWQVTDKEHIIDSLSEQLTDKEQINDPLSAQLSEQESVIVERDKAVKWVQNELRVNAKQLSKKESVIVERDKAVKWLQDELRVNDQKHQLALAGLTKQSEQLVSSIQSISHLLANERDRIAILEEQLAEKSDQLLAAERDIVEKEEELGSLRAIASDQWESIRSLSGRVVEQSRLLQEFTVEDEDSRKIIGRLGGQVADKERELGGKERQLIEKEWQLTGNEGQLAGKEQELVSLSNEREQILATLSAQLVEKEQALERTKGLLAAAEARLDDITTSRAWRLVSRYRSLKSGRPSGPSQAVSTESEQLSETSQEVSTHFAEDRSEELRDSLLATPNPTLGGAESGLGAVTLTWNAAKATDIEIRIDAPDGSLLAHGGPNGSVTTPEGVSDGTVFYLQDVTGGLPLTTENTLDSVTVRVKLVPQGSLQANPNPVPVYDGSGLASTTLTWNATRFTDIEIRVNAPDGELMVHGVASGSITTPRWVTDGTIFYLQNVTGDLPLTAKNTLATLMVSVMHKQKKFSAGSLVAIPNPIRLYEGSRLGATTVVWDTIHATEVELRLGSCDGQLLARGPACGTTTTPECFADRTILYLQNVSDGQSLTPRDTLATLTIEVTKVAVGSLLATPNPVDVKDDSHLGGTTLRWNATYFTEVEIRAGAPDGDLLVRGGASGSFTTLEPVADGTVFYLQNVSGGRPLTSVNTLDTVKILVGAGKQQTLPAQKPSAIDVICFSIVDWDFRYQRPQQIMAQFAAHGHRVFYLSTTQSLTDHSSPRVQTRMIKENVWEVKLASQRLPSVYGEVIDGDNKSTLMDSLEELRRTFKINEALGYVMVSSWTDVALEVRERFGWRVIYDCMDEWENFPGIQRPLLDGELKLVKECDLLVVTAQTLYEKWQGHNRRMLLARNAVDYEFYVANYAPNSLLTDLKYPVIGYYGAIAEWFDMELMIDVARQRPDYTFVLLGGLKDVDVSALKALPNVRLLGLQPYETMPQYLYHFDVCMIPFKINPITEATDPVKVYEYLSAGKPVVSVALPELSPCSEFLYIARDRDDFVAQLDRAVMEVDPDIVARRISFASRQTWSERYRCIVEELSSATARASIVIVTYNNLELNKLCLESVLGNTHYLNYEVIVVDNASTDGTRAYLRYMAAQHPQIQVILNQNNEGFARANNQGIGRSTGDYLVLLNNDTIVPSGWLSRLLRHLENPSIGMVGPVTNFVGNEAKIAVPYQDWTDMERFAQEHMWANDGKVAEIYMLAMFCVAFRRETYELIGPLDEQFGIGMFEDDDYSLRMKKANLRLICAADVFVHHFGQAAFKKLIERGEYDDLFNQNRRRYETKWKTQWIPHENAPLRFEQLVDSEFETAR